MEPNKPSFRLRLNFFDGIVLVAAVAVGCFLLWSTLKPQIQPEAEASRAAAGQYTVLFSGMEVGSDARIQPGDALVDAIKNFRLGTVVSVSPTTATKQILDHETQEYVLSEVPDAIDALVVVACDWTESDSALLLDGGYHLRVGDIAYIRGPGYMASGPIIAIERGDGA